MINKEFESCIEVNITANEVFEMICRVDEWWVKDIEGGTKKLGDEFTVHFGTTWVSFKVTEVIPSEKIIWMVTDCNLPWTSDLKEWKGTQIVWEISRRDNLTKISFTHIGLSKLDCGKQCMNAWSGYIKQSLFKLITEGHGLPNKF